MLSVSVVYVLIPGRFLVEEKQILARSIHKTVSCVETDFIACFFLTDARINSHFSIGSISENKGMLLRVLNFNIVIKFEESLRIVVNLDLQFDLFLQIEAKKIASFLFEQLDFLNLSIAIWKWNLELAGETIFDNNRGH